jgi:hypothetical protein
MCPHTYIYMFCLSLAIDTVGRRKVSASWLRVSFLPEYEMRDYRRGHLVNLTHMWTDFLCQ